MKIIGLDNREHVWNPNNEPYLDDSRPRSSYHVKARELLKSLFPVDRLHEEIQLPGSRTTKHGVLIADFVLLRPKLIIEAHGEQHYSFSKLFHGDAAGFRDAKLRDVDKKKWAELNGFTYITLPFMESIDEWRAKFGR